jgi:hypothetical protein
MKKQTLIKLIAPMLFVGIFIPFFSSAQNLPANPTPGLNQGSTGQQILDSNAYNAAQVSENACRTFKDLVYNVTLHDAKAIWDSNAVIVGQQSSQSTKGGCFIVPAAYPDANNIDGDPTNRPAAYGIFEGQISNGKGISQDAWLQAAKGYNDSQTQASSFSQFFARALGYLLDLVTAAMGLITTLAGGIFVTVLNWIINVTTTPAIVTTGWTVVRDICNMFFILILIVIGLSAILRIESYDYRHLLGEVVLMALLVNFSLVIAVTIMNFTNAIVAIMAPNNFQEVFKHMGEIVGYDQQALINSTAGAGAVLVQGITKFIYAFVLMVTFIALAALFVVRLVGLYILIILAPFAYVLDILPATKNLAHEWWHNFIKYLVWAPVAVFFLRLCIIAAQQSNQLVAQNGEPDSAFKFIILTALLWAAILVAHEAGMVGGNAIVGAAEHAIHGAGHVAFHFTDRKLASWSDKGGVRGVLSNLSFGAWKAGYEQRQHHKEEEAYTVAAGKRADAITKVFSSGKDKGDFERLARYQRVAQEKKRLENITDKDELSDFAAHAYKSGEWDKFMGASSKLAAQGDLNEVLFALNKTASAEEWQKVIGEIAEKTNNQEYTRLGADVTKIAEGEGDYWVAGAFERKPDGTYGDRTPAERRKYVNRQRAKASDQSNIRNLNRRGYGFKETVTGKVWHTVGIDEHGLDAFARMKNVGEWRNNGNKNAKATVAISGSDKVLKVNPEIWGVAANEYIDLEMAVQKAGIDPKDNAALEAAVKAGGTTGETVSRLVEFRESVAAPNANSDYNTPSTVNRTQIKDFFESTEQGREAIKRIAGNDKDAIDRYGTLHEYYKQYIISSPPSSSTPPPASTPPPPAPNPPPTGGRGSSGGNNPGGVTINSPSPSKLVH